MYNDHIFFDSFTRELSEARKLNALFLSGFENSKSIREWVLY